MPLRSRLGAIARALDSAIDAGVEQTATAVKQTRDELVHVDTGALKASGVIEHPAAGRYVVAEGDGLPDARALFEEYGTTRHAPHAHMTPAAEQHRGDLARNVAAEIRKAVQ